MRLDNSKSHAMANLITYIYEVKPQIQQRPCFNCTLLLTIKIIAMTCKATNTKILKTLQRDNQVGNKPQLIILIPDQTTTTCLSGNSGYYFVIIYKLNDITYRVCNNRQLHNISQQKQINIQLSLSFKSFSDHKSNVDKETHSVVLFFRS